MLPKTRQSATCLAIAACAGLAVVLTACANSALRAARMQLAPAERPATTTSATSTPPSELTERAVLAAAVDPAEAFDADRALADTRAIARLGARPGGSDAERRAADYVDRALSRMGYETEVETFSLPNGATSRNVVAIAPGTDSDRTIIVGAHFDTKPPSPGANDNASGCGVSLELARQLRQQPAAGDVRFVFYGAEEYLDDVPGDHHHLGSRFDAGKMPDDEVNNVAAMVSVDMVGYGTRMYVRSMGRGPMDFVDVMRNEAKRQGLQLGYRKDPGPTGWSDHEPYELRGIPVAWLEWPDDPTYHTEDDNAEHVQRRPLEISGRLVLGTIRGLGPAELEELCDR